MASSLDTKLGKAVDAKVDKKLEEVGVEGFTPPEPPPKDLPALKKSPTSIVVGSLIGIALGIVAWNIAGPFAGSLLILLLVYEAWTLINQYPNDTISEIIWSLAERPMVPFVFGAGFAWAITSGTITNPWFIAAIAFLMGHFFFQRVEEK